MRKFMLFLSVAACLFGSMALTSFESIRIEAAGGNQTAATVSVTLTSYFDPDNIVVSTVSDRTYGETLSLAGEIAAAPEGQTYQFLYWEWNGSIREWPIDHSFVLTGDNDLKAVFRPADRHVVAFVDANAKILKIEYVSDGGSATPPASLPDKPGYATAGWSAAFTTVSSDVIARLGYAKTNADEFAIAVTNGSGTTTAAFNTVVTVVAAEAAPETYFHHWEDHGVIVGHEETLSFTAFQAASLVAIYAPEASSDSLHVYRSANLKLRSNEFKKTYVGRFHLPTGYTLVEYGMLTHADAIADLTIDTAGVVRRQSKQYNSATNEWVMSFPAVSAVSVRSYLIAKDGSGNLCTVYDETAYEVENGGFESGNLSGWTAYGIWKDESALSAFRNERVVATENYGSSGTNTYNRDGSYHLGVYADPYDNANKDLNQERMGMLRSEDFVLAGSGFIGFKLGGGKNTATAYLSVHDASTGTELARFANRHFNNTTLSGTANAEAYLFPYYADLSAFLGRTVYLLLVDAASHEWNVLAADSFATYLPLAPTVTTDNQAINILPVITGAGSAPNSITNGALTANLTGWENPTGRFQIANGGAISSVGGNASVGCLRSPAFTIGVNHYVKFDFAGAIRYDKQVFVLVKEVGTNLEVLRLVRRADQAERADSGDFKTHWYDLGGLDTAKEYYLEVVDNRDGDWGVAMIRNVSLVASGYGSDYQVAINAYYGLATVSQSNGEHRISVASLAQPSYGNVHSVTMTPGVDAADAMTIRFQSPSEELGVAYTLASDPTFQAATIVAADVEAFSSSVSNVGGITFGFSSRTVGTALLTGLDPDTEYLFRLIEGCDVSASRSFRTAPATGSFNFLFLTDPQADTYDQTQITATLIEAAAAHYDFAFGFMTGDITEVGAAPLYWDRLLNNGISAFPLLTVPGNHDYMDAARSVADASSYNLFFANPQNGDASRLNSTYYLIYGNTLFVMLDIVTRDDLAAQQAWFAAVVTANRRDFVIVGMHYSLYGTYHEGDAATVVADWLGVFDAAAVDLVLSGHDHLYARTPAMIGNAATGDPQSGTVYLIGGSGGYKFREAEGSGLSYFEYYLAPTKTTASMITVSATAILIETIDLTGTIIDTFSIPVKTTGE